MYTFWLTTQDSGIGAMLGPDLSALAEVVTGPPELAAFRDADAPDLLVIAPAEGSDARDLERILGFVRSIAHSHRAPAPILWIEAPDQQPPPGVLRKLIDDRPLDIVRWPLDPDELAERAGELLGRGQGLASLRERARSEWVTTEVARLYAGLDLPSLRMAIAPSNARQPVLLAGEPGTRRGLLARYIHNLAEPVREQLLSIRTSGLTPEALEDVLLKRSTGRRLTLFLRDIDAADRETQEALAELLCDGGGVAIESIRWVASALRPENMVARLRQWSWLRVDLPPLRERMDLPELARDCATDWSARSGRSVSLGESAIETLSDYVWPGNLREFESVVETSLASCRGPELGADALRFGSDQRLERDLGLELGLEEEPETPGISLVPPIEEVGEIEETEPLPATEPNQAPPQAPVPVDAPSHTALTEWIVPLADEIRPPLRAIRTYANLVEQRPDDEELRRELQSLVEGDLTQIESTLQRVERFGALGTPALGPVDLPGLVAAELKERQMRMRERSLVVLRELDHDAPPALADEKQIRFAIGALLDRALRMVPIGGDLYVGSLHRPPEQSGESRHRLLLRFHSPEEVLITPADLPGPGVPIEVVLARDVIERMGGSFAVDSSGSQDNVVLIELPALISS